MEINHAELQSRPEYADAITRLNLIGYQNKNGHCFIVWAWDDAPAELRRICYDNSGDEDWLVLISRENYERLPYIPWIDRTDSCNEPDEYDFGDWYIFVGSHA